MSVRVSLAKFQILEMCRFVRNALEVFSPWSGGDRRTMKLPRLWTFVQPQVQDNEGNAVPEGKGDGEGESPGWKWQDESWKRGDA